ncbi:MAG: galactokinase family protein [Polyangiaceae bacterium]
MWRIDDRRSPHDAELLEMASVVEAHAEFFDRAKPIALARAPGRLDVMGGIADYSGSLVLEWPLSAAAWVAAQADDRPYVALRSTQSAELSAEPSVTLALHELAPGRGPLDFESARVMLTADPRRAWAAYAAGALVVLHHSRGRSAVGGSRCLLHSKVPIGRGVSSSAAIEVAAMQALAALAGIDMAGRELALLAQRVENSVVGAPCGPMDQMTAACGVRDHFLALLCQPAELEPRVAIPAGLEVWGLDSGIRHAVTGADYGSVRVGAFMGYRIIAEESGFASRLVAPGLVAVEDPRFRGYLANVSPSQWEARFREHVPVSLDGRSFLDRYQGHTDRVTHVDPSKNYALRACTEHPIYEHHRVQVFRALLEAGAKSEASRALLGELMYQSHSSYGACGLGSDGTDRLVELVREAGAAAGLYGAKVMGGGSGGTVAVLARSGSRRELERITAQYGIETGRAAALVGGSSDGALGYGVRWLLPA